jgi:hypothetical protein
MRAYVVSDHTLDSVLSALREGKERVYGERLVRMVLYGSRARGDVLEQMAKLYFRARTAGDPAILNPEQMSEVAARIQDYGQSKPSTTSEAG